MNLRKQSIQEQIAELDAYARHRSAQLHVEVDAGRSLMINLRAEDQAKNEDNSIIDNVRDFLCVKPLKNRQPADPLSIELRSLWQTGLVSYVAITLISWPDGVTYPFANRMTISASGNIDFLEAFPCLIHSGSTDDPTSKTVNT